MSAVERVVPAPAGRGRGRTRGFGKLLATELKVWLRDPTAVFFALVFPSMLLLGLGLAIPAFQEPMTDAPPPWNEAPGVTSYLPTIIALAVGTISLTTMPVQFATFREKGILKRLSTTPMPPQNLIGAHMVINVLALIVSAGAAVVGGMVVLGVPLAADPLVVLLVLVLSTTAMFSLGLLVAARADKGTTASGLGMLIYFPSLMFSGVWVPLSIMPDWMREIGLFLPLGAAAQGLTIGWFGTDGFPLAQVLVLVAWTLVLFPLGVRLFRWT
ncbi:ABC-2 type transport system permease protein [Promicromonospora sp. AC04]|uniref:ABC transporter permease n=1 Tax=Promicromonospora sp. AC04 TaxID=2135723 RepID=UPI000D33177B|nr:ABC transporter permease [Promicromonospora sp. AC04]PUB27931.1 ABC-2 type transport system permease protein [Promicromonospora sp. AC04]